MPPEISPQTKAFFMMTLWLTVRNPSLTIVTDAATNEITPNGVEAAKKDDFLKLLSSVAIGEPDMSVATNLYNNVLKQLPEFSNDDVSAQLDDGTVVNASIRFADALQVVHELVSQIAIGAFAVGQVADYDPLQGCELETIEAVTN